MEIEHIREPILVCQKMVYGNSGWPGPSPVSMLEAIRFVKAADVEEIEERDLDLASQLMQSLRETPGAQILSPLERGGCSSPVSFAIDGIEPQDAVTRLWEQHHIVARQVGFPPGIRVALHFFNTEEEVG